MAMHPDKVTHAISFLTGEVHALFMFAQMVAKTHPDQEMILKRINEIEQLGLANIAPEPVPEATVEGFQFAMNGIRKAAATGHG